ncbi:thioredoxin-domain-containing protein [Podospora aff. communis PSN243]|uniref:Protein disulfide-isomerase n=1 Tax=Podospora aff. communis PSN243 TaxID=3040156 RepID=A0AAV9G136_9PEZI|nr:thioredoxin-domain-containing protein [Podospora aff. communis PSN243]
MAHRNSSIVLDLNDVKALDDLSETHDTVLLAITLGILPGAQRFAPIFEEIAASLSASGLDVGCAQIDVAGKFGLWERFGYLSYPTVIAYHGPGNFKKYVGPLREKEILAFLARQRLPAVSFIDSTSALDHLRGEHDTVAVAYLGLGDRVSREAFTEAAQKLKDEIVFCISNIADLASASLEEGISRIVVYKNVPEERSVLEGVGTLTVEAITTFVEAAARPLIWELLPELCKHFLEQPLPLGYLFVSSSHEGRQITNDFLPLARKYKDRIQFVLVKAAEFPDLCKQAHIDSHDLPSFSLRQPQQNRAYPLPRSNSDILHPDNVAAFIEDFLAGRAQPAIKSAPIPDTQGPLVEVVGLTYDEIVLNPKKDVLVEFYTPWCGPCKAILPVYEKLAALYAADEKARDLVTIAKVECEGNDVPDADVRGFPWFKLYPAGDKERPVTYEGEWNVKGWATFVMERGSHGVEVGVDDETGDGGSG